MKKPEHQRIRTMKEHKEVRKKIIKDIRNLLTPRDFFDREFSLGIIKSEKLRSLILVGVYITSSAWLMLVHFYFSDWFPGSADRKFWGIPFWICMSLILLIAALYEGLFLMVLNTFARKELILPPLPRITNAFVEVSIPSVLILLVSQLFEPYEVLFMPMVFFYFIFIALSSLRLSFLLSFITGLTAATEYFIMAYFFTLHLSSPVTENPFINPGVHIARAVLLLMTGIVTGFVSIQVRKRLYGSLRTLEERDRVVNIFGQHVSPEVVNKLLEHKEEPASEIRYVCVMFLDIRNFTGFTEGKSPEEVISFLNSLFEFMIDRVNTHNGIINKFLGDGFMAIFGAPISDRRDIENAVTASKEIITWLKKTCEEGVLPETKIGIGLHAGKCMTGSVGSTVRKEYTIIGDVVNLASRIEQLNKKFNSSLLVSDVIWEKVKDDFNNGDRLGLVEIRGHEKPVCLYKLL